MDARERGWAAAAAGGAAGDMLRADAAADDEAHRSGGGGHAAAAPSSPPHALFASSRDVSGMFAHAAAATADDAAAAADAHRRGGGGGAASAAAHFSAPPGLPPLAPPAADVFMHDAAAPPPPEPPEALLLRRVRCVFDDTPVEGVIVSVHRTAAYGTLWRVRYSDGGEEEELVWEELRHALQPAAEAAAQANVLRGADATPAAALADEALLQQRASTLREAQRQAVSAVPLSPQPPREEEGGAGGAAAASPQPAMKKAVAYKGVSACGHRQFVATCQRNGRSFYLGRFSAAAAAARAYDDEMHAQGRREVNFPRRGEVQAWAHRRGTSRKTPGQPHPSRAAAASGAAAAAMPKKKAPQRTTQQPSSAAAAAKAPRMALTRRRDAAAAAADGTTAGVHALTPLVGRRVSLPFLSRRGGASVKRFRGTVLAPSASGAPHTYTVRFDDGDVRHDVTAAEILRRTIDDDGGGGGRSSSSSSSSDSDSDSDDGGAAPAAAERVHYVGVWRVQTGAGTRFRAQLYDQGAYTIVGGKTFRSAEAAARARDAEVRKRGLLHRLAFPATPAERAAVAQHVATPHMVGVYARSGGVPPPSVLMHKRGAGHRGGAAAHAPPPAKRTRTAATGGAGGAAAAATRPPRRRTAAAPAAASPAPVAASSGGQLPRAPRAPSAAAARDDGDDANGAHDVPQQLLFSFLRGISPSLSNLPAVLAAARSSGITLAHLAQLAVSSSSASQQLALGIATSALCIDAPGDRMAFALALAPLTAAGGGGGAVDAAH
jgi:hypothetical protein